MDHLTRTKHLILEAREHIAVAQNGDPDEDLDQASRRLKEAYEIVNDTIAFRLRRDNRRDWMR